MIADDVVETWRNWSYTGPLALRRDMIGEIHQVFLNSAHSKHFVWVGAGAHLQEVAADNWFCQGCVKFFHKRREVACFLFSDASSNAPLIWTDPKRSIMRMRGDASGSVAPVIRYQESSSGGGYVRDNLDIACFEFGVVADEARLVIDDSGINIGGPRILGIRTGFRIHSVEK